MVFEITRYDLIPIACLPIAFVLGAQSFYCTLFTFIAIVVLLSYIGISIKSRKLQTKFFFAWTICSIVCMWGIFEMTIAPEVILPRERYFLAILTFGALLFFQLTKRKAKRKTSVIDGDELMGVTCYTRHATCIKCRQPFLSSGPLICSKCQPITGRWKHHCVWLNCYITEKNHLLFLLGHTCAALALFFGANTSITSVCRPILTVQIVDVNITLPHDCSNAYVDFETSLCFMGSLYAAAMGIYCVFILFRQIVRFSVDKIALWYWRL